MENITTKLLIKLLSGISRLSWKALYRCSDMLRYLIFDVFHYRQKVILNNLRNSFPQEKESTIQEIAKKYYQNFTDIIFETIKLRNISKNDLLGRFEADTDLLDHYYAQQRNLVVVAGHLGNWEMVNLFAAVRFRYQMVVVYHQFANQTFDNWVKDVRTRFGTEMVPMQDAFARAVSPRDKPFLFVLINDQSPSPHRAYWTTFLNQDTGVFRGVELISRKLNAPVLYMGILRNNFKRGFYKFYFRLITETPKQEPTNYILQKQISFLEEDIIRQPDNWLWSHKRWKPKRPRALQRDQQLEVKEKS
jgi:KDO2-lipid IV(A) lauroyltransferase